MTDRKIVDYKILEEHDGLENLVKKYIKKGYQPYGYPIFINDHKGYTGIVQAMVKYEEVENTKTKDFNDYLKKRLTKGEIENIEKEAQEDFDRISKEESEK